MNAFLLRILCVIMFLGVGCTPKDVISSRCRILTERVCFPINTKNPVPLKFKDGYFDTFVSLFPGQWKEGDDYDLVIRFNGLSIIMRNDEWRLCVNEQSITLGEPNRPMLRLRAINRQKTPILEIKSNWQQQHHRLIQLPQGSYSLSDDGILEIPIHFSVIKSNPEYQGSKVEFVVHSNWYYDGRR